MIRIKLVSIIERAWDNCIWLRIKLPSKTFRSPAEAFDFRSVSRVVMVVVQCKCNNFEVVPFRAIQNPNQVEVSCSNICSDVQLLSKENLRIDW